MSAIQSYALRSIGSQMRGLTFDSVRMMIDRAGENFVVTLHSVDDPEADWNHRATVRVVEGDGFLLNNQYLEILAELLAEDILSVDEAETLAQMKRSNSSAELETQHTCFGFCRQYTGKQIMMIQKENNIREGNSSTHRAKDEA